MERHSVELPEGLDAAHDENNVAYTRYIGYNIAFTIINVVKKEETN
jgi:hypothetical protein